MKTVRTFGNLADAGFASSLLEAAGIKALMADEQSFTLGYGQALGGLRVQVDDADFERALRVLDEGPDAPVAPPPEPVPEMGDRIPTGVFVAGAVVLAVFIAAVVLGRERWQGTPANSNFTIDNDHDGRPDVFYVYDRGQLVRVETDHNHDGRVDNWCFYDSEGRTLHSKRNNNFDGKPDEWFICEKGETVSLRSDSDFNGLVDSVTTFVNGVAVRTDYAPNESRIVTRREIFKDGILAEEWVDENRDSVFDYKILHDPFGEMSKPIPIEPGRP